MNFSDAESKVAQLAAQENIYILIARALEDKAAELRQQAVLHRNHAQQLHDQQMKIWQQLS